MSIHIIDCEDPQLRFRDCNGIAFRCFYVVDNSCEDGGFDFRILVSVQPDQTAQIIRAQASLSEDDDAKLDFVNEANCRMVSSVLRMALQELALESVIAAYVLDDGGHRDWTAALSQNEFTSEGVVYHLKRSDSQKNSDASSHHFDFQIRSLKASTLLSSGNPTTAHELKDALQGDLVRLLDDTIRLSDDCMLRKKVHANDVLALFAGNPGDLTVWLALDGDRPIGVLVADDSLSLNRGHVEYLGVHSEFRRQSVATRLLAEFQARVCNSGLSVAIHERNLPSLCFFERQNFRRSEQYQLWTREI